MSDKDSKLISEIFLSEIKLYDSEDDKPPQGSSGRMEFDPYSKDEYRRPGEVKKTKLSNKKYATVDGRDLQTLLRATDEYYSEKNNKNHLFQNRTNEALKENGYIIARLPTEEEKFVLAKYVIGPGTIYDAIEYISSVFTDWNDALNHAKTLPDSGVS